ncbi:hypothetical protein BD410DRAFT_864528 [Rickenella mellea]|uniref:Nucleotidyltransferase n=1 Tax=Rickenella mellea TaxID=50990 RepID=A0A4Y7Q576_9AGAM|nr:hypothetical protein BD410DRAFT_864528 [Rickenella mellea]
MSLTGNHLRLAFKALNGAASAASQTSKKPVGVFALGGWNARQLGIDRMTKDLDVNIYTSADAFSTLKAKLEALKEQGVNVKASSTNTRISATWTDPANSQIHVGLDIHQKDPQQQPKDKVLTLKMDDYSFETYNFEGFLESKIKAAGERIKSSDSLDIVKICSLRKVDLIESVKNGKISVTQTQLNAAVTNHSDVKAALESIGYKFQ